MTKTFKLPFDDTIRLSSKCRFVLVRQFNTDDAKPFVVRRSDDRAKLVALYDPATDYIVDQERGFVTYHFNGREYTWDAVEARNLYGETPYVVYRRQAGA